MRTLTSCWPSSRWLRTCSLGQSNHYKFVLDWFKAQFPKYKELPDFGNNAPKVIDLAAFQTKQEEKKEQDEKKGA